MTAGSIESPVRVSIRPEVSVLALFSNLNYKVWYALAEFVDNSLQSFLENEGRLRASTPDYRLAVHIEIETAAPARIRIRDNAAGISASDFPRAFKAAEPPPDKSGLSQFGVGMKSAACWFARKWSVRTKALGDDVERTISFNLDEIIQARTEELTPTVRRVGNIPSYTEVLLEDLHKVVAGKAYVKIREHLESIYRVFLRSGRMILTLNGEPLVYEQPEVLVAPFFKAPDGVPVYWQKDIYIELNDGRTVSGTAGLRARGSTSKAGFALFRSDRVIEGSADDSYRPEQIFRKSNSYTYQRLFGELHLHGFDVSHTKDGFIWGDAQDEFLSALRVELDSEELPLLQQAEGYRSRPRPEDNSSAVSTAIESTARALEDRAASVVSDLRSSPPREDAVPQSLPELHEAGSRAIELVFADQRWRIIIDLVNDAAIADWLSLSDRIEDLKDVDGPLRQMRIRMPLTHPFVMRFAGAALESLEPILRLAVGVALSEVTARDAGVRMAAAVRTNLNELLRDALSSP